METVMTEDVAFGPVKLSDREFRMFRELIFEKSGINLHEGKKELLRTRLGSRMRAKSIRNFKDYYDYIVADKSGAELRGMLDAISTNITSFFRENNHFEFLKGTVIPALMKKKGLQTRPVVRAWSAGCSSGEEPYSIAFTLQEAFDGAPDWELKILATDISLEMLERASRGVYPEERMRTVPKSMARKYFRKGSGDMQGFFRVREETRKIIYFKRFNLMSPVFPFRHKFDFIFCRNVMIYFDKPTQEALVGKYYDALDRGGHLLIGHSESLTGVEHNFRYVRPTIYCKPE